MKDDTVAKFTRLNDKLERCKWTRVLKRIHAIVAYTCLLVVIATGALYGYEKSMPASSLFAVEAVVSTQPEFEDGEPIAFYVISELSDNTNKAYIHTTLRCDAHNGKGATYITEDDAEINPTNMTSSVLVSSVGQFMTSLGETVPYNQVSNGLRSIVSASQAPTTFTGTPPAKSVANTCFGEHTITAYTPIFKIPVTVQLQSYPFEYIWYNIFKE